MSSEGAGDALELEDIFGVGGGYNSSSVQSPDTSGVKNVSSSERRKPVQRVFGKRGSSSSSHALQPLLFDKHDVVAPLAPKATKNAECRPKSSSDTTKRKTNSSAKKKVKRSNAEESAKVAQSLKHKFDAIDDMELQVE